MLPELGRDSVALDSALGSFGKPSVEGKLEAAVRLGLSGVGFAAPKPFGAEGIAKPKSGVWVFETSVSATTSADRTPLGDSGDALGKGGSDVAVLVVVGSLASFVRLSELMIGGNGGKGGRSDVSRGGKFGAALWFETGAAANALPPFSGRVGNAGGVAPNAGSVVSVAGLLKPVAGLL